MEFRIGKRVGRAATVNGSWPRFRDGQKVQSGVTNRLAKRTSIHWHGLFLPNPMNGVPGVTFKGIEPGETAVYRFLLR